MGLVSAVLFALAVIVWLSSPSRQRVRAFANHALPVHSLPGHSLPVHSSHATVRARRRRGQQRVLLIGQAPVVAELLATAVAAGATIGEAIDVVGQAVDEPVRSRLRAVRTAFDLGADPHTAWSAWLDEPTLSQIAQAVIRSHHSGAPLSFVLDAAAKDMRHAHRSDIESRARAAGVRSVAPLALCFLPAYLLVGVVPVVAGFASSLFG
jgi:Flp pilus assembly protein TadB